MKHRFFTALLASGATAMNFNEARERNATPINTKGLLSALDHYSNLPSTR